jgi:hypothetical protein
MAYGMYTLIEQSALCNQPTTEIMSIPSAGQSPSAAQTQPTVQKQSTANAIA